jgi:hypothetical protein
MVFSMQLSNTWISQFLFQEGVVIGVSKVFDPLGHLSDNLILNFVNSWLIVIARIG